jgi:hypothetical protein
LKKERSMRGLACLLGVLALSFGCVLEDRPVDPGDGGVEAGPCGICPIDEPVCTEELDCVQCTADEDGYCDERMPVCNTQTSRCVACLTDAQCTSASAARCDQELLECVECNQGSQCSGVDGLPENANACDDGLCVDCTPETESQTCPGAKSCNPDTHQCTDTDVGSRQVCETCVADSECGVDGVPSEEHRCVPMYYQGDPFPDQQTGFCLKTFSPGGCVQPYAIRISDRESLSDPQTGSYCGIVEVLATCPAVRALDRNDSCLEDTDCPASGLCRSVGGLPLRCTYRCTDETQCDEPPNPGSTCGSSGSGGDAYCGG